MFSRFFIDRPIFAAVLSIVITLAGAITLAVQALPVAQYPEITPPTVEVSAYYPGANSKTVADTVAAPIEQQVNGVENMLYMSSQCTNDGTYILTITFRLGVDLNMAQVLVQNRVSLAEPILPDLVKRRGVMVKKKSASILMIINLFSPDAYRVKLMPSRSRVKDIPAEGKNQVIVANVEGALHFRIFDGDGRKAVDTDETRLAAQAGPIADLKKRLEPLWPPHELSEGEKHDVLVDVASIVGHTLPNDAVDDLYSSNYATIQLRDDLARLDGVGDITYMGQRDYSMRIWLDPEEMSYRGLSSADVTAAIEAQNVQVAAGQIGQPPVPTGQVFQYTMSTLGRLVDKEQFENIILKTDTDGRVVRLKDVAKVDLGAQAYDQSCTLNEKPSVALSIYQRPGSNALRTARLVRDKMKELKARFPKGLDYAIVYDTTPFINESVWEVFKTLIDAVILVAVVVLLFLQNWRSAIIPLVAVPVAIIGTFAVMLAFGFSINNLTLFGLVLAIGIVVDDAIVVVEAVEHHIEHGLSPRDATGKAMDEVSGPVVAIGLVLTAVFVPCAFISGIVGQFFRQFALTIAASTLISAFNSLTLSPALSALLLQPRREGKREALPRLAYLLLGAWAGYSWVAPWLLPRLPAISPTSRWAVDLAEYLALANPSVTPATVTSWAAILAVMAGSAVLGLLVSKPLDWLVVQAFALFNSGFKFATAVYGRIVGGMLRVSLFVVLIYGGLLYLTYAGFTRTPAGFIPTQDKGYLLVNVQMADSTSVERTRRVMKEVESIARDKSLVPGVKDTVAIAGQSILLNANAPNFGAMYVMLEDFHHRTGHGENADAIAAKLLEALQARIPDATINVYGAPPVEGLGTAGGFKVVVEDRGDNGLEALEGTADSIVAMGNPDPLLGKPTVSKQVEGLFTSFRARTPWLYLDVDRAKLSTMGVLASDVFNTLQVYLGSLYVNDFNKFGRTWQVNVQGAPDFRKQIEDLKQLKVRNVRGGMVPIAALAGVNEVPGPVMVARYNMYPSAAINGIPAPGVSSGQAITTMEDAIAEDLPPSMRFEWTELALLQLQTGNTAMYVFLLAVVLVFLVLAAQYESWSLPLAVILVVPMCLLCSIAGVVFARMDINIFTQVGFIVLVGLACKNAILIVEFAKARHEVGVPRFQATIEACELRLRPIIMTSLAFILGVVPLVISVGAGAEMRRTLGTAVFSGMLGVTLFGIFLTPVFYYVIQWFSDRRQHAVETHDQVNNLDQDNGHVAANGNGNGAAVEPGTVPSAISPH
jgi:multidrug efflux pump subunit AcrB